MYIFLVSFFFRQYIEKTVDNIQHTALVNECKYNMDKAEYAINLEISVYIPSVKVYLIANLENILAKIVFMN